MQMNVVATIGHNSLDIIKHRIIEGHAQAMKGDADWVEGSLKVAAALRDGRQAHTAHILFRNWLRQNNLNYYTDHERAALIKLGKNIELARTALTETKFKSYRLIWQEAKDRFGLDAKTTSTKMPGTRKPRAKGRDQLFRTMKLGEEVMTKIKGTSLDNSDEMDELVVLNRGAPQGELTDVVKRLAERAAAGEHVSAIAEGVKMGGRRSIAAFDLTVNWKRRMIASWKLAKPKERVELIEQLIADLEVLEQQLLIERIKQGRQ
jgi:hypothetical protein